MGRNVLKWLLLVGSFLLGLLITLAVTLCLIRTLQCLLEYRINEVNAVIILGFAGGAGAVFLQILPGLPDDARQPLLGALLGILTALCVSLVVAVCASPLSEEECFPTPTVTVTPASTYVSPNLTPPRNTRPAPTPTTTPTLTVSLTRTLTLSSPVTLIEPVDDFRFDYGAAITLWSCPYELLHNEHYQLRVQPKEQDYPILYPTKEDHYHLNSLPPGEYKWAVAVLRSTSEMVSEESEWRHFHVLPPAPVVHSISPPSTFRGTEKQVVVKGENFTSPVTLTIGVPLQIIGRDFNAITATVPTTLGVGTYPVVVQDSNGRGVSSVSFMVEELPTAIPTRPVYSPPVLTENSIIGCNVTLRWQCLALGKDDWFAVRVGKVPDVPHSQAWVEVCEYTYTLSDAGDYVWEVAICRGDPADEYCGNGGNGKEDNELAVSKQSPFSFGGCVLRPTPIPPPSTP